MQFCCSFVYSFVHQYLWNRTSYHSEKGHFFPLFPWKADAVSSPEHMKLVTTSVWTATHRTSKSWTHLEETSVSARVCLFEQAEVYNSSALLEIVRRAELRHNPLRQLRHLGAISITYQQIFRVLRLAGLLDAESYSKESMECEAKLSHQFSGQAAELLAADFLWTLNLPPVPWSIRCGITIMTPARMLLLIGPSWL